MHRCRSPRGSVQSGDLPLGSLYPRTECLVHVPVPVPEEGFRHLEPNHRFWDNVDLDIHLVTCYLSVARNVERICDHVENVAHLMLELPKSSSFSNSLVEMSSLCADLFSRSMRSFLKSDIDMAREVLLEVDRHLEDYAISAFTDISKGRKRSQVLYFMLAAESLHRIIFHSQDIAEITVDSVLSH